MSTGRQVDTCWRRTLKGRSVDAITAAFGTAINLMVFLLVTLVLLRLLIMALRWLCTILSGRR